MAKKGGKYAAVLGKLPALGIDPARRDAVTQAQEQIKAPPSDEDSTLDVDRVMPQLKQLIEAVVGRKKRQTAGKPYAAEYARAYAECRAIRDTIAEWDGAFSLLVEAYQWLMIDQMEVEGTRALTLANGQPIHTFEEPQAKVDDPDAFRRWCLTPASVCVTCNGGEDIQEHTLNDDGQPPEGCHLFVPGGDLVNKLALPWGTTNALTKEMLLHGAAEPPGVSVWKKTVVRLGAEG